jgi:hypothetical protein
MSGGLEGAYRRAMRWYPRQWRAEHEEAMIGTLLDVANDQGQGALPFSERLNLISNGLGARFGLYLPAGLRSWIASFALGTGTAFALVYFVAQDWMPWIPLKTHAVGPTFGPFASPAVLVSLVWVVAFVAALARRTLVLRIALGLAAAGSAAAVAFGVSEPPFLPSNPDRTTFVLLTGLALVALIGVPAGRRGLLASASLWSVGLVMTLVVAYRLDRTSLWGPGWYDWNDRLFWGGIANFGFLGMAVVLALLIAWGCALLRHDSAAIGIVISTVPWVAVVIAEMIQTFDIPGLGFTVNVAIVLVCLIAVIVVSRSGIRIRIYRDRASREQLNRLD